MMRWHRPWVEAAHFKHSFRWGVKNAIYDTSRTDAQWTYLEPMLPKPASRGRPPTDRRRILDAILYVVKCGCPWRYQPSDFPPWQTVYHSFRQWTLNHLWAALNDALRTLVRRTEDKHARPTAAILDSQRFATASKPSLASSDRGKLLICPFNSLSRHSASFRSLVFNARRNCLPPFLMRA